MSNVQTFIPIINPVFALAKNWKIALVSPETLNKTSEDWDECFFSRLEI
ncbi:hypothetical protein [Psychrobacter phenylpyruvicus]|nr:hypothetical protein [Psychrobacter phenylpyruvicus]